MRTIIPITSDTQCGSTVGLFPLEGWQDHDGNAKYPNAAQRIIGRQWQDGWEKVAQLRRKGDRLISIFAGDAVDGVHHNTKQETTYRKDEQERIFEHEYKRVHQMVRYNPKQGDRAYFLTGTPAHSGAGGRSDETIARALAKDTKFGGVVQSQLGFNEDDGRMTFDRLQLKVNGVLIDIAHHGAIPGRMPWTSENGLRNILKAIYWNTLEAGTELPRYYVRGHRHIFTHAEYRRNGKTIEGVILPCFQMKTDFVYMIASGDLPTIGMVILVIDDNGQSELIPEYITVEQDPVQVV